jgi:hypothetical protein
MSGQTRSRRKQCKVAVFLFARKLSDPDQNAPAAVPAGSFDTDKRATPGARASDAREFKIPQTGSIVATCRKVRPKEHVARIDGCFANSNLCPAH